MEKADTSAPPVADKLADMAIPFRSVAEQLRRFNQAHPDKTAIFDLDTGRQITYDALFALANRLSRWLDERNIGHGARVALLSGECLEKIALQIALWRHGAQILPFNVEMDHSHLRDILARLSPVLIFTQDGLDTHALTSGLDAPHVTFGGFGETAANAGALFTELTALSGADIPDRANAPNDVACIYATSGTTDRPKCVYWDHLGLWLCGLTTIDFTGLRQDDRLLDYRTFSWLSPHIVALMPMLALGLSLYVAGRFSHSRFFKWIAEHDINVAAGVPTVINMLLAKRHDITAADLPSLRLITCSSAPLAPERWVEWEQVYKIPLIQFYGATEGGWLAGNTYEKRKVGTAGPPAKHMDLLILNEDGAMCGVGEEGEVVIRGPMTAVGRDGSDGAHEDLRAIRLTSGIPTGDLAVIDEDGFVRVTGRVKELIIKGGVNIMPLEIDNVVMTHPAVAEAATIGVPDDIYGEEVACFVAPKPGGQIDEDAIRAHCTAHLPAFRVPAHIVVLDALPKSDRGKIVRAPLKTLWAARVSP